MEQIFINLYNHCQSVLRSLGDHLCGAAALCSDCNSLLLNLLLPPFFSFEIYADQGKGEKKGVQYEVRPPFQFTKDTATGTGYAVPGMQHRERDITGERAKQNQRGPKPGAVAYGKTKQQCCDEFQWRQCVKQTEVNSCGEDLVEHLTAELIISNELAYRGVSKKQHEQSIEHCTPDSYSVFHEHFRLKVTVDFILKTVGIYREMGSKRVKPGILIGKKLRLFCSIAPFYLCLPR